MKKPEIILVDDHKLFRNGLKCMLELSGQYQVIAEASNGSEFLDLLDHHRPDLVILDIKMPVMDGIEASQIALTSHPGISILILSMYAEADYYTSLLKLGVKGFLLKDADSEEFFTAVQKVVKGGSYFSQELLLNIIHKVSDSAIILSRREREVLELIGQGRSTQEISGVLNISQRTVERHRTLLLEKTGCRNSINLIVYAIKNKLISL